MYENQYSEAPRANVMPPVVGRLIWKGEPRSGISQQTGNEWKSQDFAIGWEEGQYQRCAVFTLSGVEKVNAFMAYPIGTPVEVKFSFDGHEYQGKYYGGLRAFAIRNLAQPAPQPGYAPQQAAYQPQPQYGGYAQQSRPQMPYSTQQVYQQPTAPQPAPQQMPPQQNDGDMPIF